MENVRKKIKIPSEIVFIIANVLLALAVSVVSTADFGLSMIVAPAYILHLKIGITFGQAEYVVGAILFIIFCIVVKRVKLIYFFAFLTCLFYGAVLDLFRLIPAFNPTITPPGSMDLWLRIIYFVVGELLTAFSVALSFKCYIFPQVTDFFVKGITETYALNQGKFKWGYDASMFLIALIMTLAFFGRFEGIKFGTIILTLVNGPILALMSKLIDRFIDINTAFPKLEKLFVIEKRKSKTNCETEN